jgi:hypothetical protein
MSNDRVTFETGPLTDELAERSANAQSVWKGVAEMAANGKLGALAKELSDLAEKVEKSGFTPPNRRADADRFEKAAANTTDRELASYYRDRARKARSQLGERSK